ncbi:Site-specific recombinase XerD [Clostridium cavendishii DSM 21758]|uniref:Site-specific recombinase XerD n=1 Tax=Clostridium cavendishii DSM 21758 TaxID=1121302 RepID=A0A1M6RZS0_9CLOT|nr:site-specific integrase [Clostridium cavendishii]SHK37838.1 Site-specific recombinase XerD [Clostridium cavendishii DSM 21758]
MEYNVTYRKKDNGIQVIISYKDKLSKWKQKSKQGFPDTREGTKKAKIAADKMLQELKEKQSLNIVEGSENLTIGELKKDYLNHIKTHREYNTFKNYEQSLNYFSLDDIEVAKLKLADVQKCVNALANKYSLATIQRRTTIFKCMLNFAHRQYNIPVASIVNLTLPSTKSSTDKKALTNEEQIKLLNFYETKGNDYYLVTLLALKCGLRVGEILGLTWRDIDFEKSIIDINKQWKIDKLTEKYNFGDLKSKNSYRIVPIPPKTLNQLKEIKLKLENDKVVDFNLNNSRLIESTSTYSMSSNLGRQLQRKFGICIHELRHTYATNLISNGIDFKTAAKLLGHDIEQTMKTYSHVTDDMMKKATDLISKIF